ncbi:MAG: extracellular solute-binding protein [Chloroflexi bacterium]|nr:extracellular solute-binding protein [Chloroflexota bacterium]
MVAPLSRRTVIKSLGSASLSFTVASILASCGPTGRPAAAKVKFEYWHSWSNPPIITAVAGACDQYNVQHPDQEVIPRWGIPATRGLLAAAGGQPPAVFTLYPGGTLSAWANNGALRGLNEYVKASHYDLNRFVQSQIVHAIFQGQLYALPLGMGAYMLYYNRKIFAEEGIPSPPQTLQEAFDISNKISKKSTAGYSRIGFLPFSGFAGNGSGFGLYAYLFGGKLWSEKRQQFTIDAPQNLVALKWLQEYYQRYGATSVDEFTAGFGSQAQDPFFAGKLVFEINGQWEVFNAHNFKPNLDYDVAPIPYDEQHPELKNSTQTRGNSLVLPKGSMHPEHGWSFITWMQTGDAPVIMARAVNNMPAVKSYLTNKQLTSIDPRYAHFLEYLRSGNVQPQWPATPVTSLLANTLQTDVDAATHGSETATAALAHAQSVMEQNLAQAQLRQRQP